MPVPPRPVKISCSRCSYQTIYNPNSDCLHAGMLNTQTCPRCHSACKVTKAKAVMLGGRWIIFEKQPLQYLKESTYH